jgi:molybdopterin-containing oxidoreductase family iron-sulfur binding subunit
MRRSLDLMDDARTRLRSARGPAYWRTLEELADTPAFRELVEREFPEQAASWTDPVSRRQVLTLMGASLALAGAAGCSRPMPDTWVPPTRRPEQITPGKPLFFATAMPLAGSAVGLLVESHDGRPTKIEGNPQHPASLGATDAFTQASILGLYDPDRSQAVTYLGRIRGWNDALVVLQRVVKQQLKRADRPPGTWGRGFRILTETVTSPTLAAQLNGLRDTLPEAGWHQYEPAVSSTGCEATRLAFGEPLDARYQFDKAKVVVTLDADPFGAGPGHLAYARQFMDRRRKLTAAEMNRHYAVESSATAAGLRADHRLPLRAAQVESFARALAARLGVIDDKAELPEPYRKWVQAVADDLTAVKKAGGYSVIVPGEHQTPAVHALAHAINDRLGNIGQTVTFTQPVNVRPEDPVRSLKELCDDIDAGKVQVLLILGGNPVFTAPADFEFEKRIQKVPLRIRLGLYDDETSRQCQWHFPQAHYLEAWSDTRTFDGTCTIMQPLIAPLYSGRSAHEVVAAFSNQPTQTGHKLVRAHWQQHHKDRGIQEPFDRFWRRCIHDGIVPDTRFEAKRVTLRDNWRDALKESTREEITASAPQGLELNVRADPTVFDGRFANNGWLQELPKPVTKLTWDNAAIVSPNTAREFGLTNSFGDHGGSHGETIADTATLSLKLGERLYQLDNVPVLILPGQPDGCITLNYGYGRSVAGRVGTGTGVNTYALRTSVAPSTVRGVTLTRTKHTTVLAVTQSHFAIKSAEAAKRGIIRVMPLAEVEHPGSHEHGEGGGHEGGPLPIVGPFPQKTPEHMPAVGRLPLDLYPEDHKYDGYKWGMVIDLNACTGCGGCVVACQAENNSPVVGKDQVTRAREMHWLRIDQYHTGDPAQPETVSGFFQPLMCVHCENAPCEVVCPVEATSHSADGLNEMTYNRCVGTRYCSNNCPYKVRRFNFLQYSDYATQSLKLQRNPEVTVRTRGVMEKCTFCVQRIRNAEIDAKNQNRYGEDPNRPEVPYLRDGEVLTACQTACPTQAIVFGDMNDLDAQKQPRSQVAKLQGGPRHYGLLSELNTRPRLTYLAAVRNPNPALS